MLLVESPAGKVAGEFPRVAPVTRKEVGKGGNCWKEGHQAKKVKEKKKAPGQRNQKKCAERSLDRTISEQYRIVTK